ncbi:MAG: hypothetical protein ABI995_09930, partial [Acidobacteriota bacterium]
ARVKDLLLLNDTFSVYLIGIAGWSTFAADHAEITSVFLRTMVGRLKNLAGREAMVGRWSEEIFAVVVNLPLSAAPVTPARMEEALSEVYTVQGDGGTQQVALTVRVHVLERPKDFSPSDFYLNLGQAAFSVIAH